MIKKVLKFFFLSDKRKNNRSKEAVKGVLLFTGGKSFHVTDLSAKGLGMMNQGQIDWKLGQEFQGFLEAYMTERTNIQGKVVRIEKKVVGVELLNVTSEYKELLKKVVSR